MKDFWKNVKERNWALIVALLLPNSVVYWCGHRILGHATTGKFTYQKVPTLTLMQALQRWKEQ